MASTKEYVVRLTVEGDKVIQTAVALDDGLKKAGKQAQATGKEISGAMREARSGVIGIVNDLTGGLASKFMDVKDAIGGATQGMKGFKAALIGTGIGTLVVAIGALVGYREQLTGMILDASFNLSELNEQSKQAIQLADDLKAAWGLQERELRALGATEDEILKKRKESLLVQIQQAELAAELAKEAAVQAGVADKILEQQGASGFLARWYLGTEEKAAEQKTQYNDSLMRIRQLRVELTETEKAVTDNLKTEQGKREADYQKHIDEMAAKRPKSAEAIDPIKLENDALAVKIENTTLALTAEQEANYASAKSAQEAAEHKKKVDTDYYNLKQKKIESELQMQMDVFNTLSALNDLFTGKSEKSAKRAFKISQALNIGQAIASTYAAVNAQLAVPQDAITGANYVKAGLALAVGLANVKKIASTKFEGGGGAASSGGGSLSGGEGGSFSGFQNIQPQAPTTQTINPQAQSQPVQAYVLAGNVSSETEARKKIADQARL